MVEKILFKMNTLPKQSETVKRQLVQVVGKDEVGKAMKFHESFPEYNVTPLVSLKGLAREIGVGGIYLKDESFRFGLNAFKVLGGSYAMAKYMANKLGKDIGDVGFKELTSDAVREQLGEITFVTATDGNHGKGVAWTANQLKQKAVVFMPIGSSETRLNNILKEGAEASITDMNYDDCVRLAARYAEEHDGLVVQDTAWEGYEEIPAWIMQGYGTMVSEALGQLRSEGVGAPTHVFVQAGVGSLAGAVQGVVADVYPENPPITVVAESNLADCYYQSAMKGNGEAVAVGGEMQTIMAGLACGEVNTIAWEVLKNHASGFASCPDWVAANGMRILSSPVSGDTRVVSGESGAVTTGLLYEMMTNDAFSALRRELKLDKDSKVLIFSTEGDTDPDMYRKVVWKGVNNK